MSRWFGLRRGLADVGEQADSGPFYLVGWGDSSTMCNDIRDIFKKLYGISRSSVCQLCTICIIPRVGREYLARVSRELGLQCDIKENIWQTFSSLLDI